MSFEELEQTMFDGLLIFLKKTVGPYLEDEQVTSLAEMFRRFRNTGIIVWIDMERRSALVPERGVEHVPSSVLSGLAKMGQYKFYGCLKQYPLLFFCKCRHY